MLDIACGKKSGDILLVSKPYRKLIMKSGWYKNMQNRAAIKVNKKLWTDLQNWRIISAYISPNISLETYRDYLEEVDKTVESTNKKVLLAENLNAESQMWESSHEDRRGQQLADIIAKWNLTTLNHETTPTFVGRGSSVIDVTFTSDEAASQIVD